MAEELVLRVGGTLVELWGPGGRPPPERLVDVLVAHMTYTYLRPLKGASARGRRTGDYRRSVPEQRYLYAIGSHGQYCCGKGYVPRIEREAQRLGYPLRRQLVDTGDYRPDRYDMDWSNFFERGLDFRPGQEDAAVALTTHPGGVLVAPVGFGKTFSHLLFALVFSKARIHIVVDGLPILRMAYRNLVRHIADVGVVGGGKCRFERVTLVSADSLHRVDFDERLGPSGADIVLADEVHRLMPERSASLLARYRHARMFAFTATHGMRHDGADARAESLFGEVIYEISYQRCVELGLVVPIRVKWLPVREQPEDFHPDWVGTRLDRAAIWRNDLRNQIIAQELRSLPPDLQVLVLVDKVEHAVRLKQLLPESYRLCYDHLNPRRYDRYVQESLIDPELDPVMNARLLEQMRIDFEERRLLHVIATDIWATGVSFDGLQVVAPVSGRGSAILATQGPGRGARICDRLGKDHALIIDCTDDFHPTFLRQRQSRMRTYAYHGWEQYAANGRRVGPRERR